MQALKLALVFAKESQRNLEKTRMEPLIIACPLMRVQVPFP